MFAQQSRLKLVGDVRGWVGGVKDGERDAEQKREKSQSDVQM